MKPAALSFGFGKALLLIGTLSGLIFGAVACADSEGTTPDCTQDIGDGTHQVVENGCNPFAVCVVGEKIVNPEECCKGFANDYDKQVCLAGFGVGSFPNVGTSGSTSSGG